MDTVTRDAGAQLGVSARQARRLAASGVLAARDVAGRRIVSSRSLLAVSRSRSRGRRWTTQTVLAALDLLSSGTTHHLDGSALSRLRARLRASDADELAYHVVADRATLWRSTRRAPAPAAGLTGTGTGVSAWVTADPRRLAREERLIQDLDGDTVLLELETDATAVAATIVLYAYGDERVSASARRRIEAMIASLR